MLIFLLPFLLAALTLLLKPNWKVAFALSVVPLVVLLPFPIYWIGQEIKYSWMTDLNLSFHLKISSLSFFFLLLTSFIIPFTLVASKEICSRLFYSLIFLTEGLLFGFFMSEDVALLTVFWEAMLLPIYFIINIWGGKEKERASLQFIMYMLAGSSLMIASVVMLYFAENSFDIETLKTSAEQSPYASLILFSFLLAFAVKIPLFPFHGWLPIAYYEAPMGGTILLSALLSKAGIYGILKIIWPLFPHLFLEWAPYVIALAIIGVLYGALAAWLQRDFKKIIVYSSFSHVNFIIVGLSLGIALAKQGAILQVLNHSITITALFLITAWLYNRLGSTSIDKTGGLAAIIPYFCWMTLILCLASISLPFTNNFVGEFLILFGLFTVSPIAATCLTIATVLSAIYMLTLMQKIYFETQPRVHHFKDLSGKEMAVLSPLIVLIFILGIYPKPLLEQIAEVLHHVIT